MEHRTSAEIERLGDVINPQQLSRDERLERWAAVLEKRAGAKLRTLRETEYKPEHERMRMREPNSPLTVAFEDPVLRSAGLANDTYGEAQRFFGLSDWQLHRILCFCHFGETLSAEEAAANVRGVKGDAAIGAAFLSRACTTGAIVAGSAALLMLIL